MRLYYFNKWSNTEVLGKIMETISLYDTLYCEMYLLVKIRYPICPIMHGRDHIRLIDT